MATISTVVLSGWLSDRLGKRRMLVFLGGVTMAVAAVPLALSPTWTMTLVAAVILGLGYGVYLAVDTALVTEVLPASADRGKDIGGLGSRSADTSGTRARRTGQPGPAGSGEPIRPAAALDTSSPVPQSA
ncbi:MFS transporter [Streptomyces sp. NPDC020800]|uniref:MFS transporter n=1 Tax=Streptomyces sp. NPDC020800 TaxID=3365092 RepID=UPI0037AD881B